MKNLPGWKVKTKIAGPAEYLSILWSTQVQYNVKLGVSQLGQYRTLQQTDKRKAVLSFSVTKFQLESATSAASATISKNCSYRMFQDFHVKKCPILMFCNNSQQEMAKSYIFATKMSHSNKMPASKRARERALSGSLWFSLALSGSLSLVLSLALSLALSGSLWLSLWLSLALSLVFSLVFSLWLSIWLSLALSLDLSGSL